jgi:hypothetical protein
MLTPDTIIETPTGVMSVPPPSGLALAEVAYLATRPGWLSFEEYKLFVLRSEALRAGL